MHLDIQRDSYLDRWMFYWKLKTLKYLVCLIMVKCCQVAERNIAKNWKKMMKKKKKQKKKKKMK